MIAWCPAQPGRWRYRWFASFPALGDHYIDDAHINGDPLRCHLTPLDWLRSGCRGTVMLGIAEGFAIEQHLVVAGDPEGAEVTV